MNVRKVLPIALVIACLLVSPMVAALPAGAEDEAGSSLLNPIDLSGAVSGQLAPGAYTWYRFHDPGDNRARGLTMSYTPASRSNTGAVTFKVGRWVEGIFGLEYVEVGRGTLLDQRDLSRLYWRGTTAVPRTYTVQVINSSWDTVEYAMAPTGATFPPPLIAVTGGEKQPSFGAWEIPEKVATPGDGPGSSWDKAIPLKEGWANGTLGPFSSSWATFTPRSDGRSSGLRLKFDPAVECNVDHVLFKVWAWEKSPSGLTWKEIGRSTRGDNRSNQKTWRGATGYSQPLFLEVINSSDTTVNWSVSLDDFWAYWK